MKYLGFIPARAGSNGIPGKNIRNFAGSPLLFHTIQQALKSKKLDYVFLSTDSPYILKLAKKFKQLDTDYLRPAKLATDKATTADTVFDGLNWLKNKKKLEFDAIVLLQPTSPLRVSEDIDSAIKNYEKLKSKSLISVCPISQHPMECIDLKRKNPSLWKWLAKPKKATRRQDYKHSYYFVNGALYIRDTKQFLKNKNFIVPGKSDIHIMPLERSIDIDTEFDFITAESIFKYLKSHNI